MKLFYLTWVQLFAVSIIAGISGAHFTKGYPDWVFWCLAWGIVFMFNGLAAALELIFRTPKVEAEDE